MVSGLELGLRLSWIRMILKQVLFFFFQKWVSHWLRYLFDICYDLYWETIWFNCHTHAYCNFLCLSIIHTVMSHLSCAGDSQRISQWEDVWGWYPLVLCLSNDLLYISLPLSLSLLHLKALALLPKLVSKNNKPRIFPSAWACSASYDCRSSGNTQQLYSSSSELQ